VPSLPPRRGEGAASVSFRLWVRRDGIWRRDGADRATGISGTQNVFGKATNATILSGGQQAVASGTSTSGTATTTTIASGST
jgi:autotransporter passenger strand-loop-strand repeat protein